MTIPARLRVCASFAFVLAAPLQAQTWDAPEAKALIDRAIARRGASFADSALRDWSAHAHGFVFFLGQIGEGLSEPPRLIKSDQLELEVYWRAPNQSKQRIVGWRDRRDLPTDIAYHRDHLGIVMNNFPDLIRLGEGDEVRDVPHPVSPVGATVYEFALVDSLSIHLPNREIRVFELKFRPKDFRAPRIIGSVFLEMEHADVVRMTFSFTRAAYLDDQLEDITVAVENSLWAGKYWLPLRQEIEIRRRAMFLDFPARGVIRGRFEIDGYQFNPGLDPMMFGGTEIVAAPKAVRDSFPWRDSLDHAIRDIARPATLQDFDQVRAEATAMAMGHVLSGLRQRQVAGGSVSDFVHVNRVEGLAFGLGGTIRSADQAREAHARIGVGTGSGLVTGGLALTARRGSVTFSLAGVREVRDFGDMPVISRVVNSVSSQELGRDFGDYYLATGGSLGLTHALSGKTTARAEIGWERIDSLDVGATWSRGAYQRPNPGVDRGSWTTLRFTVSRRTPSFAPSRDLSGRLAIEGGLGPNDYVRGYGEVRWQLPVGRSQVLLRAAAGVANANVPRQRAFVLGGRGTLLGEGFRSWGGSRMIWTSAELRLPVNIPEIKLGSFAGTGRTATLAPNVSFGWVGGAIPGLFATPTPGVDVAPGVGLSWFHDLLRFDAGYGLKSRRFGFSFDISRDFWDIL